MTPYLRAIAARLHTGALAVLTVVLLALAVLLTSCQRADSGGASFNDGASSASVEVEVATLTVHVAGEVNAPAVYRLDAGARVADAIELAGGLTQAAAPDALNLARVVQDGEQIVVPSQEQMAAGAQAGAAASGSSSGSATSGLVNINQATAEQLQTLSGIGPATAQKIIDSRTADGPFASVDDLTRVPGIGEKTLERLRDKITV
ncbi:ComEA family DNA-binding protein [Pseudoclavibacter soli]|uniref:ComEA family DNA-binding protein n=1 Tax=Pseudoclavibacter soli TaxID=452623 RepID=UPI0004190A3C|nr:ComEA family DNA-binding protein [Pseudoclavibacter soli]